MRAVSLDEYYSKENVSPVSQKIENIRAHRFRRQRLLFALGIPQIAFKNKDILEVGPGSGFNSIVVYESNPKTYTLIEANLFGLNEARNNLTKFKKRSISTKLKFINRSILKINPVKKYDLVLCEGVLSGIKNLKQFLKKLDCFVKPNGLLILSTVDEISYLADSIRRLLIQTDIKGETCNPYSLAKKYEPALKRHFRNLKGMSRPVQDWIVDNAVNPASNLPLYNLPEIIHTLNGKYDVLETWPKYIEDWRWYKNLVGQRSNFNAVAKSQYWAKCHNLLSHRHYLEARNAKTNKKLYYECKRFRVSLRKYEKQPSNENLHKISMTLGRVANKMPVLLSDEKSILVNLKRLLCKPNFDQQKFLKNPAFMRWFCRGQQYISLVRI
jgi:2-polyprenyl-3-methyl-5-hydroxy-6-metoxy-1,4-benzoquinol methylase